MLKRRVVCLKKACPVFPTLLYTKCVVSLSRPSTIFVTPMFSSHIRTSQSQIA
uniref:Uncharacterized protein n=1 Tax=Ciona intestinalis TaxID=7719 RepID=H2XMS1_CIOIN